MGGNDTLTAGKGTVLLDGGDGNDVIDGTWSEYLQEMDGGAGDDTIYGNGSPNVVINAGGGTINNQPGVVFNILNDQQISGGGGTPPSAFNNFGATAASSLRVRDGEVSPMPSRLRSINSRAADSDAENP